MFLVNIVNNNSDDNDGIAAADETEVYDDGNNDEDSLYLLHICYVIVTHFSYYLDVTL